MVRIHIEEPNQTNNIMNILVRENNNGHIFSANIVSVHNNLTFRELGYNNSELYPILLRLVKAGIIHSFEPKKDVTSVTFHTKYVEEIL